MPDLRAATFAAVCLGLGAGAHLAMSGDAIPVWALVVGGLAAYLPARYAAGRGERGLFGIAGLMGGLQVAFHLLFSFAQHSAGSTGGSRSMPGAAMPAGMSMPAGMQMPAAAPTMAATAGGVTMHMHSGMLIGHALAALACAWCLWRGEAAAHAVIRSVSFRLPDLWVFASLAIPPVDRTPRVTRVASRPRAMRSQWLRSALAVRGPPRLSTLS